MQSLLLLKQTLEGPSENTLNLDGTYLHYSRFSDLVFGKPSSVQAEMGFEFNVQTEIPNEAVPRYFPSYSGDTADGHQTLDSTIAMTFRQRMREGTTTLVLSSFEVSSFIEDQVGPKISGTLRGGRYRVKISGEGVDFSGNLRGRRVEDAIPIHFLPHFLVTEQENDDHIHPVPLPVIFMRPMIDFEQEIGSSLKYLGPLREKPQRAYLHSGSPMTDIGDSGQYAAQVLWLEQDRRIEYAPSMGHEVEELTLLEAVNRAFGQLGISQPLTVKSEKSIVYQMLFGISGDRKNEAVTIADVGFGVSQLLPIVTMGLRSSEESLLMFEQPEIHLHPKLQANLADFLLSLVQQERRLIVETHSDYFINRLRRRIAEDDTNELQDKVNILFVKPSTDDEGATIEPLRIDKFGVIENWPPDFLPEAADEAEAIFSAGLSKRGA